MRGDAKRETGVRQQGIWLADGPKNNGNLSKWSNHRKGQELDGRGAKGLVATPWLGAGKADESMYSCEMVDTWAEDQGTTSARCFGGA